MIKSEHPADFDAALQLYRDAMDESRQYILDHDLATMPAGRGSYRSSRRPSTCAT